MITDSAPNEQYGEEIAPQRSCVRLLARSLIRTKPVRYRFQHLSSECAERRALDLALALSGVARSPFTRCAIPALRPGPSTLDPYTLHVIAGHTDMNTTKRYVHPGDADVLQAMERARKCPGRDLNAGPIVGHLELIDYG